MADLSIISIPEIQAWLEKTKLTISTTEPDDLTFIELYEKNIVYGRLAQKFDTSTWLSASTTPSLVRQIIAMRIAAIVYRRQYSEDLETTNPWAMWLEKNSEDLIMGLINASIVLQTEAGISGTTPTQLNRPTFYPTDISSAAANQPYFAMDKIF